MARKSFILLTQQHAHIKTCKTLNCQSKIITFVCTQKCNRVICENLINCTKCKPVIWSTVYWNDIIIENKHKIAEKEIYNGILLPKLFWPTVRKNCSSDQEKLLKFEAEGREFAKFLRSLEQFIQTVKGQNNFW